MGKARIIRGYIDEALGQLEGAAGKRRDERTSELEIKLVVGGIICTQEKGEGKRMMGRVKIGIRGIKITRSPQDAVGEGRRQTGGDESWRCAAVRKDAVMRLQG
jgi:hypothetical protein